MSCHASSQCCCTLYRAGELEPTAGSVWRHPNLRIAAVAQHAFTHLEQHLDKTPNQYIQWRFAAGEDREGLAYAARQVG